MTYVSQEVREALQAARRLITDRENWSSNGPGNCITTFCVITALVHVTPAGRPILREQCLDAVSNAVTGRKYLGMGTWNDNHSHEQVLAAMDAAAEGKRYVP